MDKEKDMTAALREDGACATPLLNLLRGVPLDARMTYEHDRHHHQMIPVGRLCHEAADALQAAASLYRAPQGDAEPVVRNRVVIGIDDMPLIQRCPHCGDGLEVATDKTVKPWGIGTYRSGLEKVINDIKEWDQTEPFVPIDGWVENLSAFLMPQTRANCLHPAPQPAADAELLARARAYAEHEKTGYLYSLIMELIEALAAKGQP